MGIAMRSNIPLPITLPALFWKPLVGDVPDKDDLEAVDVIVVRHLAKLRDMKGASILSTHDFGFSHFCLEDDFETNFGSSSGKSLNFTIFSGKTVELIPNGSAISVT